MKNIAIIGGGVAGLSAAIYALRANAQVTLFEQFGLGGLVATIDKIENYPSYPSVEGWALADSMAKQAKALGLNVVRQKVLTLTKQDDHFVVTTDKGEYTFPAVVVATGTSHNKLGIEGDYVGKGVSYCATCDGNFFRGRPVAVVGGGNTAVKEALYLADIASTVFVVAPTAELSAEQINLDTLLAKPNVVLLKNTTVSSIFGQDMVEGIAIFNKESGLQNLQVNGVFVAIGALPVTDFVHVDGVATNKGYLVVDEKCQTSVKGLFAAGDVANGSMKQIVTACADGAKAGSFAVVHSALVGKTK